MRKPFTNSNCDFYSYSYSHSNRDGHSHGDSYANSDGYSNAYTNCDTNTNSYSYRETRCDTTASTNAAATAVGWCHSRAVLLGTLLSRACGTKAAIRPFLDGRGLDTAAPIRLAPRPPKPDA